MNHCCLIGGGGLSGSYVTGALLAQGRQVTILDTRPAPRNLPRAATYVVGDYGNKEMLRKALTGADAVINLSYASVLDSAKLHADSGWKIRIPFRDGIRRMWHWFAENQDVWKELNVGRS